MIFLKELFKRLNEKNVNYCILRNYENLPHSLNSSDIDILVEKKHVKNFYKILNEVLKAYNGRIIIKYGKYTPRICILGIHENNAYGLQIDVHEGILPYKTKPMFPTNYVLKNKKIHNEIYVADKNDAYLLSFLKEILNNLSCKESYFTNASFAWKNRRNYYSSILSEIYSSKFLINLDKTLSSNYSKEKIMKLAKLGRKDLIRGIKIKKDIFTLFLSKLYRLFHPPGFTIAFLGVDGSGKTTIINAIKETLKESVHNSIYYEHMRPNLFPNLATLLGRNIETETNYYLPHKSKPSNKFISVLRFFYYLLDYILGYWIKIYPVIIKKSSIWLFDRYIEDFFVDPKRSKISLPEWFVRFFYKISPKPDLYFVLVTDPEIIYQRKQEVDFEELKRQVEEYKKLCDGKRYICIDVSKSIEEVKEEIILKIMEKMSERY